MVDLLLKSGTFYYKIVDLFFVRAVLPNLPNPLAMGLISNSIRKLYLPTCVCILTLKHCYFPPMYHRLGNGWRFVGDLSALFVPIVGTFNLFYKFAAFLQNYGYRIYNNTKPH